MFFTFGKRRASVAGGFIRTIDDYFGTSYAKDFYGGVTVEDENGKYISGNPGYYNFSFGGLLQSYHQTRTATEGLRYSVTIVDPREILSNCILILNHYTGTTFGNSNLINIHGFLEHNASDPVLFDENDTNFINHLLNTKKSVLNEHGIGMDLFLKNASVTDDRLDTNFTNYKKLLRDFYGGHPMTGTGMSRRTSSGIPYYRVVQALSLIHI